MGMLPRSFQRTFDRLQRDLDPKTEEELVRRYRRSRANTVTAIQFLLVLILVPLLTQQLAKHFVVMPFLDQIRGGEPVEMFINAEMKEEALEEIGSYEEELKFQALVNKAPFISDEEREELVKLKAIEVTEAFRAKSKIAVSNVYADLIALGVFLIVLVFSRRQIAALKAFVGSLSSGLSDAAKAFVLILASDIVVGFHSPHGWEVLLEGVAGHLGIAASHSGISVFIATVPVVMDTAFKYWIFSSLTKLSPSTVATLKEMDE